MSVQSSDRQILRHSALLYSSLYVFVVFKFVAGFVVARFLGPSLYGLRTLFGLAEEYEQYAHLGTFDAMRREVPFHRGRGDREAADDVLRVTLGANLAYAGLVGALLLALAAWIYAGDADTIYGDFCVFLALQVGMGKLALFLQTRLVTEKRAVELSRTKIVYGVVNATASMTLVYFFGLRGLFAGLLIGTVVRLVMLRRAGGPIPRPRWDPAAVGQLLKIGFPIMLIAVMFLMLRSVDRIVIAGLLSKQTLGYFGIASIVSGVIYHTIAEVVGVILYPRIMEKLGRTGDRSQVKHFLVEPTVLIAYLAPFLIGVVYLSLHLPLVHFAARYEPAISVAKTLTLGAFFFSVVSVALLVCVALNRQLRAAALTFGAVLLNGALSLILIRAGWDIDGVAVGTAISYAVFTMAVITFALTLFGAGAGEIGRMLAGVLAPFAYAWSLLFVIESWLPRLEVGLWQDLASTSLRCAVFVLSFALILLPARRHTAFTRLLSGLPRISRRWVRA